MADYCTTAEVKAELAETLGSSTDTTYDTLIGTLITSASRLIDGYVGRWDNYFYPSSDGETRYYDGNNRGTLPVDELVSLTFLGVSELGGVESTDYVEWSSSDYFTEPYNYTALNLPITKIIADVENGTKAYSPARRKVVKITGIFGRSATIPADVKQACKVQALRYFMRAKNAYQDAGANPSMGQMFYVKELDPDVKLLLHKYVLENL